MLNPNTQQDISLPLTEDDALTINAAPLECDPQGEAGQAAKKGSLLEAVSSAVAEVLASRFMRGIISVALGGIASEGVVHSASAVEAPNNAQPLSASSSDVAAAHPHKTLPGLHSYDRD